MATTSSRNQLGNIDRRDWQKMDDDFIIHRTRKTSITGAIIDSLYTTRDQTFISDKTINYDYTYQIDLFINNNSVNLWVNSVDSCVSDKEANDVMLMHCKKTTANIRMALELRNKLIQIFKLRTCIKTL